MRKEITGYEGIYSVTSSGDIYSDGRIIDTGSVFTICKERKLKQSTSRGYKQVSLYKDKKMKTVKVHKLVALMFCKNYRSDLVINHRDGNKLNNSSSNLEWCTSTYNEKHAKVNNLKASFDKNGRGKLTRQNVIDIQEQHWNGKSVKNLALEFNVCKTTIRMKLKKEIL